MQKRLKDPRSKRGGVYAARFAGTFCGMGAVVGAVGMAQTGTIHTPNALMIILIFVLLAVLFFWIGYRKSKAVKARYRKQTDREEPDRYE